MDGPLLKEFIAKASKCGAFKNWTNESVSQGVLWVLFPRNSVGPCYMVFSTTGPERPQWKQIFSVLKSELL